MKFTAKSAGGIYDPFEFKNPYKLKWDAEVQAFNDKAPPGVNNSK